MMSETQRKSRFSLAWIEAVAAVAGYHLSEPPVDEDSIDGTLAGREGRRPRLEFQAKATAAATLADGHLLFDLPVKNYNDLRIETLVPRVLIVVQVPQAESEWLQQSEAGLLLRHCGYWLSLLGMPETANQGTVRVRLPLANRFEPAALRELMNRCERRESP